MLINYVYSAFRCKISVLHFANSNAHSKPLALVFAPVTSRCVFSYDPPATVHLSQPFKGTFLSHNVELGLLSSELLKPKI